MVSLLLIVVAIVVLMLAAVGAVFTKVNLLCLGLALWAASQLALRYGV